LKASDTEPSAPRTSANRPQASGLGDERTGDDRIAGREAFATGTDRASDEADDVDRQGGLWRVHLAVDAAPSDGIGTGAYSKVRSGP
jgi:hypothetical protein